MWPILPGKFYCLELGYVRRISLTAGLITSHVVKPLWRRRAFLRFFCHTKRETWGNWNHLALAQVDLIGTTHILYLSGGSKTGMELVIFSMTIIVQCLSASFAFAWQKIKETLRPSAKILTQIVSRKAAQLHKITVGTIVQSNLFSFQRQFSLFRYNEHTLECDVTAQLQHLVIFQITFSPLIA